MGALLKNEQDTRAIESFVRGGKTPRAFPSSAVIAASRRRAWSSSISSSRPGRPVSRSRSRNGACSWTCPEKGLHDSNIKGFYHVARACLVKSEADFDTFDLVFARYFEGIEGAIELPPELLEGSPIRIRWRSSPRSCAAPSSTSTSTS